MAAPKPREAPVTMIVGWLIFLSPYNRLSTTICLVNS